MPYGRDEPRSFPIYHRDFWEWAMTLVKDPVLAPYMEWSAQKLYKWNGEEWVRFVNEPWTADLWWEEQVCILMLNTADNKFNTY